MEGPMKGWTIAEIFDKVYSINTYARGHRIRYSAILVHDASSESVRKYGQMTKDEAIAMMKLLNASQTN